MKINRNQYLQLVGLLTLAEQHTAALKGIERAAVAITKEDGDSGHTFDAVYGDRTPDELLRLLEIEVVDEVPA